jgi:hypothetical protein
VSVLGDKRRYIDEAVLVSSREDVCTPEEQRVMSALILKEQSIDLRPFGELTHLKS